MKQTSEHQFLRAINPLNRPQDRLQAIGDTQVRNVGGIIFTAELRLTNTWPSEGSGSEVDQRSEYPWYPTGVRVRAYSRTGANLLPTVDLDFADYVDNWPGRATVQLDWRPKETDLTRLRAAVSEWIDVVAGRD